MNLLDPSTLATGGIIAVIAGFWSQTKNILAQVSSVVVVQSRLATSLIFTTRTHIKRHYKALPSGLRYYTTHVAQTGSAKWSTIPFRLIEGSMFYYGKGRFFIFTGEKIISLRGFCDVDQLLIEAIREEDILSETRSPKYSRFQVYPLIGREKGMFASRGSGSDSTATSKSGSEIPVSESSSSPYLDVTVDKSFMYPRDFYIRDFKEDPFLNLYFPPEVMEHIKYAEDWITMGSWYAERGIPWRRGWGLEGPGGTGKSSLARAMAEKLGIPLYDFKLSTLSDQEFLREWSCMHSPCVALFEDFDTVFNKRENLTEHKSLSFDTILNVISGVNSFSGVFLIITTNHLEKVDPAMGVYSESMGPGSEISTRPGRIDTVIRLGNIKQEGKDWMARKVLKDWPDLIEEASKDDREFTPVQFQELCLQKAFNRLHEIERSKYSQKHYLQPIGFVDESYIQSRALTQQRA